MTAWDITATLRLSNVTLPTSSLVAPKTEVMTISAIEHGPLGVQTGLAKGCLNLQRHMIPNRLYLDHGERGEKEKKGK